MSSHRESFAHRSRNLLPLAAIWEFPIPHCDTCKAQMVKLEHKWGCKVCSKITALRPVPETVELDGEESEIMVLRPTEVPLGEMYPNRAARRRVRR